MAFECPRRSSPPSPMFDADTGCIATDPAPSARRRFRSKTGIENLPANEHAQETPHTPSPTRTTRRIQSGCAGSRPRLRDGMPGSPSQHIDITRAKWPLPRRLAKIRARLPKGVEIELWWQDEARIGQKNKLTRRWARRGTRPRAPRDQRTEWAYIFGAICPAKGKGAGLVMPWCDTDAMAAHLIESGMPSIPAPMRC